MKHLGFDWDEINTTKLAAHDLATDDVEELFDAHSTVFVVHPEFSGRRIALGFIADGRFILVSFEYLTELRWVRVVTAYEAGHERWWKIYAGKTKGPKTLGVKLVPSPPIPTPSIP